MRTKTQVIKDAIAAKHDLELHKGDEEYIVTPVELKGDVVKCIVADGSGVVIDINFSEIEYLDFAPSVIATTQQTVGAQARVESRVIAPRDSVRLIRASKRLIKHPDQ